MAELTAYERRLIHQLSPVATYVVVGAGPDVLRLIPYEPGHPAVSMPAAEFWNLSKLGYLRGEVIGEDPGGPAVWRLAQP